MLKALKNKNYTKIWKAVIKNRHPEAESLEEALRNEVKYGNCLYSFDVNSRGISMCNIKLEDTAKIVATYNKMQLLCGQYHKKYSAIKNFTINLQKDLILGRPITLEDILVLCKEYFAGVYGVGGIFKLNGIGEPANYSIIKWDFTKPLHEQTEEIWEAIYNLI